MVRRIVMLAVLSVFTLGISAGCGGPGSATTIERDDRPSDLRQRAPDQPPNKGPGGNDIPDGVIEA